MAKKRMPIYGRTHQIWSFLAYILAKLQYFEMESKLNHLY